MVLLDSKSNTAILLKLHQSGNYCLLFFCTDISFSAQHKINWLMKRGYIGFKEITESTVVHKGRCSSIRALDELKPNFDSQGFSDTDLYPLSSS